MALHLQLAAPVRNREETKSLACKGFWSVLLCEAALVETAESASARQSKVSDVLD